MRVYKYTNSKSKYIIYSKLAKFTTFFNNLFVHYAQIGMNVRYSTDISFCNTRYSQTDTKGAAGSRALQKPEQ